MYYKKVKPMMKWLQLKKGQNIEMKIDNCE